MQGVSRVTTDATTITTSSGADLRALFATAAIWLERNAAAVNAINVFPVPDGDTGTNMSMTLRAAVDEAARAADTVAAVAAALARGALMGARGNSGVILSQYLRGVAERLASAHQLDGAALAEALVNGATVARAAVAKPVEGTILTVARDAGAAAQAVAARGGDVGAVLEAAVDAARDSVARTPELLPVLKEAGVVDSGALGLLRALEGALRHRQGEPLPATIEDAGRITAGWLAQMSEAHGAGADSFGYCIEFVLKGAGVDRAQLHERLTDLGDSVLVVGDDDLLHVHLHSDEPGTALSLGTARGALINVKVDNMQEQAQRLAARPPDRPAAAGPFAVVAVAAGAGLAGTLRGAGAAAIVSGGQTMNPSTRELLDAIDALALPHVVLLPNNKNIVWTAEQAARLSSKTVDVIPTTTIPQGIAALLALNPDDEPVEALREMRAAAGRVRTVEVTRAARGATINGIAVEEGGPIALLDDELVAAGATAEAVAITALEPVTLSDAPLITVYYGGGTAAESADDFAVQLRERWPSAEVEVLSGGQPFYQYVISVE